MVMTFFFDAIVTNYPRHGEAVLSLTRGMVRLCWPPPLALTSIELMDGAGASLRLLFIVPPSFRFLKRFDIRDHHAYSAHTRT